MLLQADGWRVVYLGQDTPLGEAFDLARDVGARVLMFAATMSASASEAAAKLDDLARQHPELRVERGGAAFDGVPVDKAVRALRRLRRRPDRSAPRRGGRSRPAVAP